MRRKSGSIRIRSSSGVSLAWRPAAGNNLMTFHRRRADVAWGIIKLLKLLTSAASQSASAFTHPSIAQLSIKDVPPPRGERLYMHIYQSRMLIPASASRLLIVDVPPRVLFRHCLFLFAGSPLKDATRANGSAPSSPSEWRLSTLGSQSLEWLDSVSRAGPRQKV